MAPSLGLGLSLQAHVSLDHHLSLKFNFDDHNCDLLDHYNSFTDIHVQGYEADNPNIELLRLKNFTIGSKLPDDEVVRPGGLDRIASLVGTMTPFVSSPPRVLHFHLSSSRVAA